MRILLQYLLPLLLPTVIYIGYVMWARRRALAAGTEAPDWRQGPFFWLALSGMVLVVASLLLFATEGADDRTGSYSPPRMEDGKLVPGEFIKPDPPVSD